MTLLYANKDGLNADTRTINFQYYTEADKTRLYGNTVAAAFSGVLPSKNPNASFADAAMACVEAHAFIAWLKDANGLRGSVLNYVAVAQEFLLLCANNYLRNADDTRMIAITKDYTYLFYSLKDAPEIMEKEVPTAFGSCGVLARNLCKVFPEPQELYQRCSKFDGMINTKLTHIARSSLKHGVPGPYIFVSLQLLDVAKFNEEQVIAFRVLASLSSFLSLTKGNKPRKRPLNIKDVREASDRANALIAKLEPKSEEQLKKECHDLFGN